MTTEEEIDKLNAKIAEMSSRISTMQVHINYIKEENDARKRTTFALLMSTAGAIIAVMVGWFASGGTGVK